ncbi:MAG: ABC transporter [Phycisphaerae bacterium]|nr:MAG: ABC transporter [Phycisphaerae bacterium]
MNTLRYLVDPMLRDLYWPGVVTGLAVACIGSLLSVLVVLKRLAFVGQGVSHAAFGGAGLVAVLGLIAGAGAEPTLAGHPVTPGVATTLSFIVVVLVCLGSALLIGVIADRGSTEPDTAVGIVLVVMMSAGAVMIHLSGSPVSWESFLFGSVMGLTWRDAALAWGVALAISTSLWGTRRQLLFWAFDPEVARVAGVRDRVMNAVLMTLLALAIVTAMKLAGVVLATAMLVLPGATALRWSDRLWPAVLLALGASLAGVVAGVVLSFETDWPTGPCIVAVLGAMYATTHILRPRHAPR